MRTLIVLLLATLAQTAFAQEKAASGSDPAQGFSSPLPVGTGATLNVGSQAKTVTVGLAGQRATGPINFWQVAFSGTTNDEGEGLAYSSSSEASPGWKAKVGFGYSSFLSTTTRPNYSMPGGVLLTEAWCVNVLESVNKKLKNKITFPTDPAGCKPVLDAVTAAFSSDGLEPGEKPDAAAMVRYALAALEDFLTNPRFNESTARITRQFVICREFKQEATTYYALCADGGAPSLSIEDTAKKYPQMAAAIMPAEGVRAFQYKGSLNWLPSVVSAAYRPRIDGVIDLATAQQWTRLLHGISMDNAFYYKNVIVGLQASLINAVDIKLASVCKTTVQGDFSSERCKDAALGEPDPGKVLAVGATISLDPLVNVRDGSFLRSGAQLTMRYENPSEGVGHRTEVAVPIYIAPTSSPMKMVVGVKPAWLNDTTDPENEHPKRFSVMFFIGARP